LHDPVLDHIQRRVRADSRIERVAEIATLHLGPTSVLVALTVAFKPSLTLTDLRAAIRDLTMGPKEVEGRNPHVYLRPILRSGDPVRLRWPLRPHDHLAHRRVARTFKSCGDPRYGSAPPPRCASTGLILQRR